ncbi:hypothetical protein [Fulvimarina endophytica]|uniref:hypothetical protein n=1 Tax=Fulvimarina endophytica TaxID=2293836 RepID=UPI0011C01792|nr:hypothetical protein [Fulvimarina endophytica]
MMLGLLRSESPDVAKRVSDALSRIVRVEEEGGKYTINLPILYPNGNGSVVEITPNGDKLFVSDMGLGHFEAEFSGASSYYDAQANSAASRYGIRYDGHSVFAIKVGLHQIEAAIGAVANASVQAATQAIHKSIEDTSRRWNEDVFDRITDAFDKSLIAKTMEINGFRDAWEVHNVVTLESGGKAVFEFVSPHTNSVSNKFMMFSDIANSDEANLISLNGVVEDIPKFNKARGTMLSDLAEIIALDASNDEYRRAAYRVIAA